MHLTKTLAGILLVLAGALGATGTVHAQATLTWTKTVYHLDWRTASHVVAHRRHVYLIVHPKGKVVGYWTKTIQRSPHVRVVVRYPSYYHAPAPAPSGYSTSLYITGYSWGCGTPNATTSNGDTPHVGSVSSDTLPFNTRVYVPSLNYYGIVDDRGVGTGGLDLFAPDCSVALTYTGTRAVIIS